MISASLTLISILVCAAFTHANEPRTRVAIPHENVVRPSDFLLLHGNGVKEPEHITEMVRKSRGVPDYRLQDNVEWGN